MRNSMKIEYDANLQPKLAPNYFPQELVARMSAFTNESDSWATKVSKSALNEVDLTARYSSRPVADGAPAYFVYGAALCEVEVDILTGEKNIRNTSLMTSATFLDF